MTILSNYSTDVKLSQADIENLPNYREKNAKERSSSCPVCGGEDRFLFWPDEGNYWCRQCDLNGFIVDENDGGVVFISPELKADIEARKRQAEQGERERKLSKIELLQRKRNDLIYHQNLNGKTGYVKRKWGLTDETIEQFKVGYCQECPTFTESDSITIPYYWQGKLINIRHRLNGETNSGKYRPEMAGLPSAIFNADRLLCDGDDAEDWVILVEGEFKTMVLEQYLFPTIGIPGATNFKEAWLKLFAKIKRVFVMLDPGVEEAAKRIAVMLGRVGVDVRIVTLPCKPDDFLVMHGGSQMQLFRYMEMGRPV